ncbi:nuclear factor of activated T-cells, cytoplasmic 2 [Chanos chanos]|uniref:Nuclear factor of activated T-cells, cytoplasmic 2 n=1 Tax=Chanos chanos TaxID=29144 RepID=A0A6J2VQM6_CHACN|nr:nuclear factor of activated T-cells, cytoplasmic 2-like [Chanos chanos]
MNYIYDNSDRNPSGLTDGNGQDELDFPYLFPYNPQDDQEDPGHPSRHDPHGHQDHESPHQFPYHQHTARDLIEDESPDLRELLGCADQPFPQPGAPGASASPRIEITSHDQHHQHRDHVHTAPVDIGPRPTLTVPGYDNSAYREACLSPASSNSSTSWQSEVYSPLASPCVSPGTGGGLGAMTVADLCPKFQAIHATSAGNSPRTSPTNSPRTSITEDTYLNRRASSPRPGSRSASPQGKRTYAQYENPSLVNQRPQSPSPQCRREEPARVEPYITHANLHELGNSFNSSLTKPVPNKMVRPNQEGVIYRESQLEQRVFPYEEVKREPGMEPLYVMPFSWHNQLLPGVCSVPVASVPALEWPLPSAAEQHELRIEIQPRQHHRAHYETEGSRGAVKAHSGGHPVVQLHGYRGAEPLALQVFIGTADERALRPHAFYQVHRITGKTVTTCSQEKMVSGTKVLELPLEPKENMRAVVDCAGILKLKNADIELRKGETDVGRKNTRVRLVFRVHVPQPGGQWLSLQVASQPIECSQRSAHELPAVERQDVDHCSVLGGLQMILTGQNFTSDSRVVFTEKTHDGLQIWEAEATVDRDKSQASMLFVEIPPYRDQNIYHPVKVNFHVLNGKRKRSQPQHFTYTPLTVPFIKTEPVDEYQFGQLGCAVSQILGVSPHSRHHTSQISPDSCSMPGMSARQPVGSSVYPPASEYQVPYPSVRYPSQAHSLGTSPTAHYLPRSDLSGLGTSPVRVTHIDAQQCPTSVSQFGASGYVQQHQRVIVSEGYQTATSQFHTLDVSDLCSSAAPQRPAGPRLGPPGQNRSPHQSFPPPGTQRSSVPAGVRIKEENLDQAYLDDVNDIIRKDLTVLSSDQ